VGLEERRMQLYAFSQKSAILNWEDGEHTYHSRDSVLPVKGDEGCNVVNTKT